MSKEQKFNEYDSKAEFEVMGEKLDGDKSDLIFKVIVIGNSGVGKSCLTSKAIKGVFEEEFLVTIGFEFFTFNVKIDNKIVSLKIWDTCGQETYKSIIKNFFRNANLAIVVYSIEE